VENSFKSKKEKDEKELQQKIKRAQHKTEEEHK